MDNEKELVDNILKAFVEKDLRRASPAEILDTHLEKFYEASKNLKTLSLNSFNYGLVLQDEILILNKLVKDHYIEKVDALHYSITFEGKYFMSESIGYRGKKRNEEKTKIFEKIKIIAIILNAVFVLALGFLSWKSSDKANTDRDRVKVLEGTIDSLVKVENNLQHQLEIKTKTQKK